MEELGAAMVAASAEALVMEIVGTTVDDTDVPKVDDAEVLMIDDDMGDMSLEPPLLPVGYDEEFPEEPWPPVVPVGNGGRLLSDPDGARRPVDSDVNVDELDQYECELITLIDCGEPLLALPVGEVVFVDENERAPPGLLVEEMERLDLDEDEIVVLLLRLLDAEDLVEELEEEDLVEELGDEDLVEELDEEDLMDELEECPVDELLESDDDVVVEIERVGRATVDIMRRTRQYTSSILCLVTCILEGTLKWETQDASSKIETGCAFALC